MARLAPLVLALALAGELRAAEPVARIEVSATAVALAEPFEAKIEVEADAGTVVERRDLRGDFGPIALLEGVWSAPTEGDGRRRMSWTGKAAAYEIGDVVFPSIEIPWSTPAGGSGTVRTAEVKLTVRGTLPSPEASASPPEIADVKPPVALPPDWRPVRKMLAALLALLAVAGALWWAWRRLSGRFRGVAVPDDPFRRLPPHVWVYEELQRLLDRRLAEAGHFDEFFEELSRIVKRYLSGRYRVDLMERTTDEVPGALVQAGAGDAAARGVRSFLDRCDLVKFAREAVDASGCRDAVDQAYRLVDATKPAEEPAGALVPRTGEGA